MIANPARRAFALLWALAFVLGTAGEGFGLHSVRERLTGHFADRASFQLTRDEGAGITVARITMPNGKVAA